MKDGKPSTDKKRRRGFLNDSKHTKEGFFLSFGQIKCKKTDILIIKKEKQTEDDKISVKNKKIFWISQLFKDVAQKP